MEADDDDIAEPIPRSEACPTPVPDHVRGLLCALAYGWTPMPLVLGAVEQLRYGEVDLSDSVNELRVEDGRLVATLGAKAMERLERPSLDESWEATLVGGAHVRGDGIRRMSRGGGFSREQGVLLTIETDTWSVIEGDAPSLWVGRVEGGPKIDFSGNLIVERRSQDWPLGGHRRHFALSGTYEYYFVQCGARDAVTWHLVIDTNGAGIPDPAVWGRDFLTLEFVLGRQMRMPELVGLTANRRTVAHTTGSDKRKHLNEHAFSPVPMERDNDKWIDVSWVALFFERISAAWRKLSESDKSYWLALDMYLDAMAYHLDFDYMRLQIALEAFAFWLLRQRGQDDPVDVKDKAAWEKWVKEHGEDIRSHAVDGREGDFYVKIKMAWRRGSGNVVKSAFSAYGVKLTGSLSKELRERDTVVHQGLMASEGYDTARDLQRVATVRVMLTALIALSAGYGGAINGWEVGGMGLAMEERDWWKVNEADRVLAQRRFIAEEGSAE